MNPRRPWSRKNSHHSSDSTGPADENYDEEEDAPLVAVKLFRKSVLKRKARTLERDRETHRMRVVHTALDRVEREIALMKKLAHPNLVEFYEAIDSPDSDVLYLVRCALYIIISETSFMLYRVLIRSIVGCFTGD